MKTIAAFFRLIRWPNILFIVITQLLFYYCVYTPLLSSPPGERQQILFFLLILSSVMVSAAGYIINDYFDLQIDAVNRPDKMIVDRYIKRRWAILWHWILSATGILISGYISYRTGAWLILLINFCCVVLLWFYSVSLKKKLLSGNISIAALTAWVILVVYLFAGAKLFSITGWAHSPGAFDERRFFKFTWLYAGFAFIMTIIREVIKDIEDMEGDRKYGCKTMPIVWGVPASKVFAGVWIIVCMAALFIVQLYAWQSGRWPAAVYIVVLVIAPMGLMLRNLYRANVSEDYHRLSNLVKLIMLAGILSMLLFKFIG